jgi:hypothetical protein
LGLVVEDKPTEFSYTFSGPPVIESLEYGVNEHGLYMIKCTTSGTPPTRITWRRNGVGIDRNDGTYKQTQSLINRTKTEYHNVLMVDGSFEDAIGSYSCTVDNSHGTSEIVSRTIKCNTAIIILPHYNDFKVEGGGLLVIASKAHKTLIFALWYPKLLVCIHFLLQYFKRA